MFVKAILAVTLLGFLATSGAQAACKPNVVLDNPTSAFKIDGAIAIDTRSGLQWQRCTTGMNWDGKACVGEPKGLSLRDAMASVERYGDGWRLPTAQELDEIMEPACSSPSLNPAIFPDIRVTDNDGEMSWSYWSSTHDGLMKDMVYVFDFRIGLADIHSTGYQLYLRAVRPTRSNTKLP